MLKHSALLYATRPRTAPMLQHALHYFFFGHFLEKRGRMGTNGFQICNHRIEIYILASKIFGFACYTRRCSLVSNTRRGENALDTCDAIRVMQWSCEPQALHRVPKP